MKSILTALVLATAGIGAHAAEYTTFDIPTGSTLTRAEVRAQEASRTLGREVRYVGDASVFDLSTASTMTRAEAASRVLGRTVIFNEATTFVDEPVDARTAQERSSRVLGRSLM